jgi:hypothetical protein
MASFHSLDPNIHEGEEGAANVNPSVTGAIETRCKPKEEHN